MVWQALRTYDCAPRLRDDYLLFEIFITHNTSWMEIKAYGWSLYAYADAC